MRAFNAMGVRAVPFGVPTAPELAHDFLWRVHAQVPGDGEIVIFNRSHYEGVLADPAKRWKFRLSDLRDRERWDIAIAAFDDALTRCSTAEAPWHVIPSDHKWFRNLAVGTIVADAIEALHPAFPVPEDFPADLEIS